MPCCHSSSSHLGSPAGLGGLHAQLLLREEGCQFAGESTLSAFLRRSIPPKPPKVSARPPPPHQKLLGVREPPLQRKSHQRHKENILPGTCHAHRGRSHRARRVCHPGPCRPPAAGTPSQGVSSRVHMVYLRRERGK